MPLLPELSNGLRKEWIIENINPNIEIKTSGQELNPQTYSICKSDMLISGGNPDNIKLGSSLSEDGFQGERFDYMINDGCDKLKNTTIGNDIELPK